MKDIEELEGMTFWDITSNEGNLTHLVLGVTLILLGIGGIFIATYYKLKYLFRR